ncbi:MAG: response regulator transcription factor [Planctomycetota bacterium]
MTKDIEILIVDDHAVVRESLSERLTREPGIIVVGTADTADKAIAQMNRLSPDIVLMDIDMPGLNCFEAARSILVLKPDVRIIFLSAFVQDRFIEQALDVQARSYLTKSETPETVVAAIREVAAGGAFFSQSVQDRLVIDSTGVSLAGKVRSRVSTLTRRESEILTYLAKGLSKKEIAEVVHLSVKTIDHHTTQIMRKLNIHDRVELARFAIREGFAEP